MEELEAEDKKLYQISQDFSELTNHAKRLLEDIQAKSNERKK